MRSCLVALTIVLVGCGPSKSKDVSNKTKPRAGDPYFEPYIVELNKLLSVAGGFDYKVLTPVVFGEDFPPDVLARCWLGNSDRNLNYIEVNRARLEKEKLKDVNIPTTPSYSDRWLLTVLLHEVGHCDFYQEHQFDLVIRERYKSIWSEDGSYFPFRENRYGYSWNMLRRSIMWPRFYSNEDIYDLLPEYAGVMFGKEPSDIKRVFDFSSKEEQTHLPGKQFYQVFENQSLILETEDSQMFFNEIIAPFYVSNYSDLEKGVDLEDKVSYSCYHN